MAYVFAYPQVQQELMTATLTEASKEIPNVVFVILALIAVYEAYIVIFIGGPLT
jgi:hypothetical protein